MKGTHIIIRATDEEKASWQAAAEDSGMNLSQWLRWLATRESKKTGN